VGPVVKPPFGIVHCRQASELLSRAREARLSPGDRIALTLHLAICVHCRRYGRQVKLMGRAFRAASTRVNSYEHDGF
jgi:hypothetical protein